MKKKTCKEKIDQQLNEKRDMPLGKQTENARKFNKCSFRENITKRS